MSIEHHCSESDQTNRDIPSFIEPRPPLVLNPFMRPRPQKGTNLMELYDDFESDEADWVQVYLRLKPCDVRNNLYMVKSDRSLITSIDIGTAGHGRRTQHNISKMYTFSHIFGPESDQKEIFERVVKENLKKLPEGHNFTLLTYGASGSGKTYTLMGTVSAPGLVPRSLEYVFRVVDAAQVPAYKPLDGGAEKLSYADQEVELQFVKRLRQISAPSRDKYRRMSTQLRADMISSWDLTTRTQYYVWVSFIEIYNESVYDLLTNCDRSKASSKLRIREDNNGNVYVKGATQAFVRSGEEAYDVMVAGKHNLQVAATGVHQNSSRSHCIFTITMLTETEGGVRASYVRLCDLAGSERARHTRNTGARMAESRAINSSLHVLERCLHTLRRKQRAHDASLVPYRESKLTRLLGAGLSGSKGEAVSMVVTLNPAPQYAHETRHVLQLAAVARDININQTTITESSLETTQDTVHGASSCDEVIQLRVENERLHFELAQAENRNKELIASMEEKQQEVAKTMYEIVEETKDMTTQYYESQLEAMRNKMKEMKTEYETRIQELEAMVEGQCLPCTPSKLHRADLQTNIAILEEKLTVEKLARARAEEEVQHLRACIEERDEKGEAQGDAELNKELEEISSDSESEEDPANQSLEPSFKKEDINRSKVLQRSILSETIHSEGKCDSDNEDFIELDSDNDSVIEKSGDTLKDIDTTHNATAKDTSCMGDNNPNETYHSISTDENISKSKSDETETKFEQIRTADEQIQNARGTYFVKLSDLDRIKESKTRSTFFVSSKLCVSSDDSSIKENDDESNTSSLKDIKSRDTLDYNHSEDFITQSPKTNLSADEESKKVKNNISNLTRGTYFVKDTETTTLDHSKDSTRGTYRDTLDNYNNSEDFKAQGPYFVSDAKINISNNEENKKEKNDISNLTKGTYFVKDTETTTLDHSKDSKRGTYFVGNSKMNDSLEDLSMKENNEETTKAQALNTGNPKAYNTAEIPTFDDLKDSKRGTYFVGNTKMNDSLEDVIMKENNEETTEAQVLNIGKPNAYNSVEIPSFDDLKDSKRGTYFVGNTKMNHSLEDVIMKENNEETTEAQILSIGKQNAYNTVEMPIFDDLKDSKQGTYFIGNTKMNDSLEDVIMKENNVETTKAQALNTEKPNAYNTVEIPTLDCSTDSKRSTYFVGNTKMNDSLEGLSMKENKEETTKAQALNTEKPNAYNTVEIPTLDRSTDSKRGTYFVGNTKMNDSLKDIGMKENKEETTQAPSLNIRKPNAYNTVEIPSFKSNIKPHRTDPSLALFEQLEEVENIKQKTLQKPELFEENDIVKLKKKTYFFKLSDVNTEGNKKHEETKSIDHERSPSIVKDDIGNYEPSAITKLLGESFTKSSSARKNLVLPKKQASVDLFDGFESPITVARDLNVEPQRKPIENHCLFEFIDAKKIDTSNTKNEEKSPTIIEKDINIVSATENNKPVEIDDIFVKPKEINFTKSKTSEASILDTCVEKAQGFKIENNVESARKHIENLVLENKPNELIKKELSFTAKSKDKSSLFMNETQSNIHINKQNNTLDEFDNIYKDISVPRASEFDLLITQNSTMLNETSAQGNATEKCKYNLRHKGNTSIKKDKSFENKVKESIAVEEVLLETKACESQTKTRKRTLRLRRRKNQEDNFDQEKDLNAAQDGLQTNQEPNTLKDIINLQKEFSDVTMDVPAPKKDVVDIQSPEKRDEGENIPPMGIQTCPSKSVTRSRRKLFTPRAEPMDESLPGDNESDERVRVPRPSYHRTTRARRKL